MHSTASYLAQTCSTFQREPLAPIYRSTAITSLSMNLTSVATLSLLMYFTICYFCCLVICYDSGMSLRVRFSLLVNLSRWFSCFLKSTFACDWYYKSIKRLFTEQKNNISNGNNRNFHYTKRIINRTETQLEKYKFWKLKRELFWDRIVKFQIIGPNPLKVKVKKNLLYTYEQKLLITMQKQAYESYLLYDNQIDSHSYIHYLLMKQEEDCIHIEDDEIERMEVELAPKVTVPIGNTAFDVHFQLSVESLKEEVDPKAQLIHRLSKFFEYNRTIEPGQHFRPRRQPAYHLKDVETVPNMLILFGSDFKRYKAFKAEYNTQQLYKINDSNSRLVYQSFEQAWDAILRNAKQPSTIVKKFEGEDAPIPKGWFQMKGYTHLESHMDVQVRFATTDDIQIQPEKEELIYSYKDSKEIFNTQESRLRDEERLAIEAKREKIQFRKQKVSENLYKAYQNQQGDEWMTGKNSNPGANRSEERERSRSRDKNMKKLINEANEDAQSNCSFRLTKQLNKMSIGESSSGVRQEELDLSFDKQGTSAVNLNAERGQSSSAYNWKGSEFSSTTRWSYRQYVQMKEREEQVRRKKAIPVVIID